MFHRCNRQAHAPILSSGAANCCHSAQETLFWQRLEVDTAPRGGSQCQTSPSVSSLSSVSSVSSLSSATSQSFEVRLVAIRDGARFEVRLWLLLSRVNSAVSAVDHRDPVCQPCSCDDFDRVDARFLG